ncbi:MAG: cytochrome c-type biogenesis protein CcmI [Alphaproteobacteria bacterium]|jgi:cytochrome c-type biogenesis protein CcmI
MAMLFVCYPIIKQKLQSSSTGTIKSLELSNANVIKQRITELASEVNEGLIDPAEKENAIRDLKLALVAETPEVDIREQRPLSVLLLVVLALPAIGIGAWVYWQSNQLEGLLAYKQSTLQVDDLRAKLEEQGPQSLTPNDFAKFALSIRSNLQDNPDDVRGWGYLAMLSTSIGRVDEGIAAYKKALDLAPQDDDLRFKFAEALMLQGTEKSLQNSARQLNYLVQKQPDNGNNRLLLTSVAIQLQDAELAVTQFLQIKDDMNPTSQFYQTIVTELRKLGVVDVSIVGEPSIAAVASTQAISAGALAIEAGPSSLSKEILINVNISDALQSRLPEQAYLIVFAQHSDGRSRAPLAVKRFALPSLPVQISLSDTDAMIPAMNLSSAQQVNITARISLDEDVMPSAGELEGSVLDIDLAAISANQTTIINVIVDKVL